jgi:glyoxylase-like metal-dependent hydrolase (beta-lactamase superfamily II)
VVAATGSHGETIELGSVTLAAIALTGHTTDMTGLLIEDRALISGDSLFADGIARPDLQQRDPGGARAMVEHGHPREVPPRRPGDPATRRLGAPTLLLDGPTGGCC